MDTPRQIDVDSTLILRWYVEDQISTNFHVISMYLFDVISLIKKSTSFPRIFFNIISMVEKSALFPRTFFGVISLVKKGKMFPRFFIDVVSRSKHPCFFHVLFSMLHNNIYRYKKILVQSHREKKGCFQNKSDNV